MFRSRILGRALNFGQRRTMETYNGHEQPTYRVIPLPEGRDSYELRHYPQSKWTSTALECGNYKEGSSVAFRKLLNYITGNNSDGSSVSMTVPVVTRVTPTTGQAGGLRMVKSFYLPKANHDRPPVPSDNQVFTDTRDDLYVYVRRFGGHATGEDWSREAGLLRDQLKRDNVKVVEGHSFYAVGYDNPRRTGDRRNEVWIRCPDKP